MPDTNSIGKMLDRLGEAVSSGDLEKVSACYAFPVVLMREEDTSVVEKPEDFEKMFETGRNWYIEQGIAETRPEILRVDKMTDTIASVDVRWPGFDDSGAEIYTETSHYIVQSVGDQPLIRIALSRTEGP